MKIDKIKIYLLEIILLVVLILALFESSIITKQILSIILVVYAFFLKFSLKKRNILSINNKSVFILMIAFAVIYLILFYISGLYFGYYTASVKFGWFGITHYIIPISLIIIASEYIRYVLLSQNSKVDGVFTLVSMTLVDIIVYSSIYDVSELDDFLVVLGFITFASISCNLLYNYISKRYGYKPIIAYRLITALYSYIIPIIPDVYVFFRSIVRMITPYIIYLVLEYTYAKNDKVSDYTVRKKRVVSTTVLIVFMGLLAGLISCQFKYGILVIGSGSMTGTIDKGDAVVFESYKGQTLTEGDVIIFEYEDNKIVHRIVSIEKVNGEYRYYTKGDANTDIDNWYITLDNIEGVVLFKIKYIGYPTIWLNDMFE